MEIPHGLRRAARSGSGVPHDPGTVVTEQKQSFQPSTLALDLRHGEQPLARQGIRAVNDLRSLGNGPGNKDEKEHEKSATCKQSTDLVSHARLNAPLAISLIPFVIVSVVDVYSLAACHMHFLSCGVLHGDRLEWDRVLCGIIPRGHLLGAGAGGAITWIVPFTSGYREQK